MLSATGFNYFIPYKLISQKFCWFSPKISTENAKTSPDSVWVCLWDKILLNILWSMNSTHILRFAVPHWAFYSGCMNIPFMPLWTRSVFDLPKNHVQIFLQCSPHTNIHTQHMCICLLYNAERQLALDESYKNGIVCEHVSERFGFIVEIRGSLVTKRWHVYPSMFFLLCLEYVYWFFFKVKKKIACFCGVACGI